MIESGGRAIGTAGLHEGNELGFILHPDTWGRSLATEMLEALIPWLFEITKHGALTVDIDPRNQASCAVVRKVGFVETGRATRTWCIAGEWCDSVYLRLDRPR